jgi:calcineurin-like phosphoesterase family protein
MDIWVTGDQHFDHYRLMVEYCKRPFQTTKEMNEYIISTYNELVKRDDLVIHLGDIARYNWFDFVSLLNGNKELVLGNHDKNNDYKRLFKGVHDRMQIKVGGVDVILDHFPIYSWNKRIHGSVHCFGHVHGKFEGFGRSMDVGVDTNNFAPYNLEDVVQTLLAKDQYYIPPNLIPENCI